MLILVIQMHFVAPVPIAIELTFALHPSVVQLSLKKN